MFAPSRDAGRWNCDDVALFLEQLGLVRYQALFAHQHIDGRALLSMTDDMLTRFGITENFLRRKILYHISLLPGYVAPQIDPPPTTQDEDDPELADAVDASMKAQEPPTKSPEQLARAARLFNEQHAVGRIIARSLITSQGLVDTEKLAQVQSTHGHLINVILSHIPFKLLCALERAKHPLITQSVLNECMEREEWMARRYYLTCDDSWHNPSFPGIVEAAHLTLDVFDNIATFSKASLSPDDEACPKVPAPFAATRWSMRWDVRAPVVVESLKHFEAQWRIITSNVLKHLDWTHLVAAGGAVVSALTGTAWTPGKGGDIDLFLLNVTSEHQVRGIVEHVWSTLKQASPRVNWAVVRTRNVVTIAGDYPSRLVQIVLKPYRSITEVLCYFDLDSVCCAYDGKRVWCLPRARRALTTGFNTILPRDWLRDKRLRPRALKYMQRGFGILARDRCCHIPRCEPGVSCRVVIRSAMSDAASYDTAVVPPTGSSQRKKAVIERTEHIRHCLFRSSLPDRGIFLSNVTPLRLLAAAVIRQSTDPDELSSLVLPAEVAQLTHRLPTPLPDGYQPVCTVATSIADILKQGLLVDSQWRARFPRDALFMPRCYQCSAPVAKRRLALCETCVRVNDIHQRRLSMVRLDGFVCLVTGARIKVGFEVALSLLKQGATVIGTSRFPKDAARRFRDAPDWEQWKDRLHLYALDLRVIGHVISFADHIIHKWPRLDILIQNAAQTIRHPRAYYTELAKQELIDTSPDPCIKQITSTALTRAQPPSVEALPALLSQLVLVDDDELARTPQLFPGTLDGDGVEQDLRRETSWNMTADQVEPMEMLEVVLINSVSPFILLSKFMPLLRQRPPRSAFVPPTEPIPCPGDSVYDHVCSDACHLRWGASDQHKHHDSRLPGFVVNVTSPEGQFASPFKTHTHVHTNMAKAALNMMTRTVAQDLAVSGVFLTGVDPGWLSEMQPTPVDKLWIPQPPAPLTPKDGAIRILEPIVSGLLGGEGRYGVLLSHFVEVTW